MPDTVHACDAGRSTVTQRRRGSIVCSIASNDMAQRVRNPAAVRAVGRANGLNAISIVVPCHRVLNKNGDLGSYGGGLWRKRRLLPLEAAGVSTDALRTTR